MMALIYWSIGFFAALTVGVILEFPGPILLALALAQLGFYFVAASKGWSTPHFDEEDPDE